MLRRPPDSTRPDPLFPSTPRLGPRLAVLFPLPVDSDRIAGDPRLWPGNRAVLADQPVDERRLAGVGPPDDRELERAERLFFVALCLCLTCFHERLDDRAERVEQIDQDRKSTRLNSSH